MEKTNISIQGFESVPMVNFLTRYLMRMKECKTHYAEVKKTRADISRKIEAALKER